MNLPNRFPLNKLFICSIDLKIWLRKIKGLIRPDRPSSSPSSTLIAAGEIHERPKVQQHHRDEHADGRAVEEHLGRVVVVKVDALLLGILELPFRYVLPHDDDHAPQQGAVTDQAHHQEGGAVGQRLYEIHHHQLEITENVPEVRASHNEIHHEIRDVNREANMRSLEWPNSPEREDPLQVNEQVLDVLHIGLQQGVKSDVTRFEIFQRVLYLQHDFSEMRTPRTSRVFSSVSPGMNSRGTLHSLQFYLISRELK